jgi:hypothetical protein
MNRTLCVLWLALAGVACTRPAEPDSATQAPEADRQFLTVTDGGTSLWCTETGECLPASADISQDEACSTRRWIGVRAQNAQGGCPSPQGVDGGEWVGTKLFEASAAAYALPPGLEGFCLYEWKPNQTNAGPHVSSLKGLLGEGGLGALDRDCHVMGPLGTSAGVDAGWTTLHQSFHAQSGRLAHLPSDAGFVPSQVRVAVVDSTPHGFSGGEAGDGLLDHGYVMGRIIRELGCPDDATCVAQVANHLALPQVTPNARDVVNGGYFGYQTQLALAIHNAVSDWRRHQQEMVPLMGAPPQPRLVINLSVAWDGEYGGAYGDGGVASLRPSVRAVHAAITDAVCRGALVIAAAGNDPGGPAPVHGPMYPAAWETKPAPTHAQCEGFEGPNYLGSNATPPNTQPLPVFPSADAGTGLYRPLVYAVGGVRADDMPLSNVRPGGRPRLAAPGSHAVAVDDSTSVPRPTDVLTGSSASAAVVSGIAATVWGYRPSLTAPEVMATVRQSAVDLGVPADFCLEGSACASGTPASERSIRRVSLCHALKAACSPRAEHCPPAASTLACVPRPARSGHLPRLSADQLALIDSSITLTVDGSAWSTALDTAATRELCGHTALRGMDGGSLDTACPFRQFYSGPKRPWTGPQPKENPCPLCRMATSPTDGGTEDGGTAETGTLYLGIDSDFSDQTLSDPTLRINDSYEVRLHGMPGLSGGDEVEVTGIPLDPAWGKVRRAVLNLRGVNDAGVPFSTMSDLLLGTEDGGVP